MNSMTTNRMTVLFDDRAHAEAAVNELQKLGVNHDKMSIIARHDNDGMTGHTEHHSDTGDNVAKGTAAGIGVGALFGLAAAFIPGVGPFITAGTLLTSALGAAGGGAVAGAVVGGTSGLIAGALANAGYDERESQYYGSAVESGSTLVAIDTTGLNVSAVQDVLSNYGARTATM